MAESLTFTTLGELIRGKRTEMGISLSELGRVSGVSKGVLSKIESGETKRPELRTLKPIADALGIPYEEIIERYIEIEHRIEVLDDILQLCIEVSSSSLMTKVAMKFLENSKEETYVLLEHVFCLANNTANNEVRLSLYNTIIKYSRVHGIPPYIAKPSLQKYLIERQDLKNMEESFKIGEEVVHYADFLSEEEQIILYFRMALQAYAIKKYETCIELCQAGIVLEKNDTELKARAYLAMINSYSDLHNYDSVEDLLDIFERFEYKFVQESSMITRAITKAKKKEYEIAIPMLKKSMDELSKENKIHVINELLGIYVHFNIAESIHEIINKERELLPDNAHTPYKLTSLARYYRQKGAFQINKGLLAEGMESYINSITTYGKIGDHIESTECLQEIFKYFSKNSRPIDLQYVKKLEEAYNEINGKKSK
ncbi:XRE family transcriptional regulator [Brevibacillus laterosporus]|nr:helix-turn-helix transcriptional regulator [Brevibacillus laterosporus]TPG83017.1 XRE family transcriptional regulator [Brevibacillus laterosporus]